MDSREPTKTLFHNQSIYLIMEKWSLIRNVNTRGKWNHVLWEIFCGKETDSLHGNSDFVSVLLPSDLKFPTIEKVKLYSS